MDRISLSTVVLLICFVSGGLCYPTRPLNERSPELAWQAWLLIDDQNQNGRQNEGFKKRITPKSVFIAPTFSPQDLPPCAEGYASDSMGRCMKIFKLDEDIHLNFLLEKIKEKFGGADLDYSDGDEEDDSPLQFNIPLSFGSDEGKIEEPEEEAEMAIVVAPTNSNFNQQKNLPKLEKDEGVRGVEPLLTTTDVPRDADSADSTIIDVRFSLETEPPTTESVTETPWTIQEEETTEAITTIITEIPTSTINTEEQTQTTDVTTTEDATTLAEIDVESTTTNTLTTEETTTLTTSATTTTMSAAAAAATTSSSAIRSRVKFPMDMDFVRFPGKTSVVHRARDTSNQENFPRGPVSSAPPFRFPDARFLTAAGGGVGGGGGAQPNIEKPLVFRFSRKNSYLDTNQFKRPDFYRALPSDDLSYIFGFKRKRKTNR